MGQKLTLPFHGTVSALSEQVLVSNSIRFPFITRKIRIAFPPGANRLVRIKIFTSTDPSDPSSGEPLDNNLFAQHGQVDYFIGDDDERTFEHEVEIDTINNWLKVYANNLDGFDHTIDVIITIERINNRE